MAEKPVEVTNEEIKTYLKDLNEDIAGKLENIFFGIEEALRKSTLSIKLNTDKIKIDDGGNGFGQIGVYIPSPKIASYLQHIFIGYYFDEEFRNIKFHKKDIPEIVIFFGREVEYSPKILEDKDFCKKVNELKKYGVENIIDKDFENEQEKPMFYKRKSITDFDILSSEKIVEFVEITFKEICSVGLNEHKYFKEFGV